MAIYTAAPLFGGICNAVVESNEIAFREKPDYKSGSFSNGIANAA